MVAPLGAELTNLVVVVVFNFNIVVQLFILNN